MSKVTLNSGTALHKGREWFNGTQWAKHLITTTQDKKRNFVRPLEAPPCAPSYPHLSFPRLLLPISCVFQNSFTTLWCASLDMRLYWALIIKNIVISFKSLLIGMSFFSSFFFPPIKVLDLDFLGFNLGGCPCNLAPVPGVPYKPAKHTDRDRSARRNILHLPLFGERH